MDPQHMLFLADLVLAAHAALALYLTFGLAAILVGGPRWALFGYGFGGWRFVRNRKFRLTHLVGMAIVAAEALLGIACPLTDLESFLRAAGHAPGYSESFIAHWLGRFLYYDFDERVFAALYLAALGLTVWAWRRWRAGGRAATPRPSQAP